MRERDGHGRGRERICGYAYTGTRRIGDIEISVVGDEVSAGLIFGGCSDPELSRNLGYLTTYLQSDERKPSRLFLRVKIGFVRAER